MLPSVQAPSSFYRCDCAVAEKCIPSPPVPFVRGGEGRPRNIYPKQKHNGRWEMSPGEAAMRKNKENLNIHLSQQLLTVCMKLLLFNGFISSPASLLLGNNKLSYPP